MSKKLTFRKVTKGLGAVQTADIIGKKINNDTDIQRQLNKLKESVNTLSKSGESEGYKGSEGDIKINKIGSNKYEFYIRGEDGWHRDNNAAFAPLDSNIDLGTLPTVNMTSGQIDYSFQNNQRLTLNLDPTKVSTASIATPTIKGWGHLQLDSTQSLILNPTTEVKSETPIKIKETSAAVSDTADYGQLWVKDETEQELYFTRDDGVDIQLTYKDHLAPTEQTRIQVRNDEGSIIPAGAPIYSKGEIGGSERIKVGICDANDSNKMPCIGIAYEEMNTTSTQDNYAVVSGVYNTNLSGYPGVADGDIVYVSNTGSLTLTKPTNDDDLIQNVGIVIRANTPAGQIQGMLISTIGRTNDVPNVISCNEITSGAVVWERFPFIVSSGTAGRYYYRDVDDGVNSFALWDDYDTDPTGFSYLDVPGQYVVPEDCTLKAMSAVVTNFTSTTSVTLSIYHGTPNLDTTSDTTLALAGTATTVTITTARRAYSASATYDVDLTAGDIIVPTVSHANSGATQTMRGNITLKFVTR